jgi:WD40 repeat protein
VVSVLLACAGACGEERGDPAGEGVREVQRLAERARDELAAERVEESLALAVAALESGMSSPLAELVAAVALDATSGGPIPMLMDRKETSPGVGVAWAPDESWFAVVGGNGRTRVFDGTGQHVVAVLPPEEGSWSGSAITVSPDGGLLVSGYSPGPICVWRSDNWSRVARLEGHVNAVTALKFCQEGSRLLSAGWDGIARLWSASTWTMEAELVGLGDWIYTADCGQHAETVAAGGLLPTPIAWVWDGKWRKVALQGHTSEAKYVFVERGSSEILSVDLDGRMIEWGRQGEVRHQSAGDPWPLTAADLSQDGRTWVTGGVRGDLGVWGRGSGVPLVTVRAHYAEVATVSLSPNGLLVASGGEDGSIALHWVGGQRIRYVGHAHAGSVRGLAWGSGSRRLVSIGEDGGIMLWNARLDQRPRSEWAKLIESKTRYRVKNGALVRAR